MHKFSHISFRLLALVVILLSVVIGYFAGNLLGLGIGMSDHERGVLLGIVIAVLCTVGYLAVQRMGEREGKAGEVGFRTRWREALVFSLVLPLALLAMVFPAANSMSPDSVVVSSIGSGLLLYAFSLALFSATVEEFLFRGVILGGLLDLRVNTAWALIIQAALFSLAHYRRYGDPAPALGFAFFFLDGMMFGLLMITFRNIWVPVAAHFGWDFGAQLFFGRDGPQRLEDSLLRLATTDTEARSIIEGLLVVGSSAIWLLLSATLGVVAYVRYRKDGSHAA